jgi:RimJ/RimL family protein N-acetyltransferase
MKIVWGNDPELNRALAGWLEAQLNLRQPYRPPYKAAGIFDNGELIAVVLFENYKSEAGVIEIAIAATAAKWLTRPIIGEIGEFAFNKLGCQAAIMRSPAENTRVMRILTGIGFDHVLLPRLRGRNSDERMYILTDDDWKAGPFARPKSEEQGK